MTQKLAALVGIFVLAVVGWLLLRERDATPGQGTEPSATTPVAAPSPTAPTPMPPVSPTPRAQPVPPMLAAADAGPTTPRSFKRELLGQLEALEPTLRACVEAAAVKGDGAVRLRFIIANGDAGVVVELAEVAHEGTTLGDAALHGCLAEAPREMKFAPIRADIDAISVSLDIAVVGGEYAGTGGRDFSFLRDSDHAPN